MMTLIDSWRGRTALVVANCAGLVDLVALPIWVGALVARYGFDSQQAGALPALFLAGAMAASILLASNFQRVRGRMVATLGFGVSAAGFGLASVSTDFATLAALHSLCGLATGAALSVTHGTIACSARPQRLFAMAGMALGVFAVLYVAATPQAISAWGGPALFLVFSGVMAAAALTSLLAFPQPWSAAGPAIRVVAPLPRAVWFGIAGIAFMSVVQAMTMSFLERAGIDRGFGRQSVNGVLVAVGLVNLFPAALAALLERRLPSKGVLLVGPAVHGALAVIMMTATEFAPYAVAAAFFPSVIIFTHVFGFGLLARLDPSGRVLAATPATLMVGSAVGPILGGSLVKYFGYGSVGIGAAAMAGAAVLCFLRLPSAQREALALT